MESDSSFSEEHSGFQSESDMSMSQSGMFSSIAISSVSSNNENRDSSSVKIITLGNVGVGKSTMIASYARGACQSEASQQSLVEEKVVERHGIRLRLSLSDTAGQERYDSITESYYRGTHGCLLCFDVTNEKSYSDLITWYNRLKHHCDPLPPTLLVGTKADLRLTTEHIQTITSPSDCHLAGRNLGLKYKEVSCHKQETMDDAMNMLVDMILERRTRQSEDENQNELGLTVSLEQIPQDKGFCKNLC